MAASGQRRYTRRMSEVLLRRTLVPEAYLATALPAATQQLRAPLPLELRLGLWLKDAFDVWVSA